MNSLDISCELSENFHVNCLKNNNYKKKKIKMSSAAVVIGVLRVNSLSHALPAYTE